jgi:hypothetical protein
VNQDIISQYTWDEKKNVSFLYRYGWTVVVVKKESFFSTVPTYYYYQLVGAVWMEVGTMK